MEIYNIIFLHLMSYNIAEFIILIVVIFGLHDRIVVHMNSNSAINKYHMTLHLKFESFSQNKI
jgi:hypothetical protein